MYYDTTRQDADLISARTITSGDPMKLLIYRNSRPGLALGFSHDLRGTLELFPSASGSGIRTALMVLGEKVGQQ